MKIYKYLHNLHPMELKELQKLALEIKNQYSEYNRKNNQKEWTSAEYIQGLVGDVGDLTKLVMSKNGYRHIDDVDKKIAHELSDVLWSTLILANELNVNLEESFVKTMKELKERVK